MLGSDTGPRRRPLTISPVEWGVMASGLLLLAGFVGPWVSPQSTSFYSENSYWLDHDVVELFRPLLQVLGCSEGCDFTTLIDESRWQQVAATLERGESLYAWQLLARVFPVSGWLWLLAFTYPVVFILAVVRMAARQSRAARLIEIGLAGTSVVGLLLSVWLLPTLDTLGYSLDFTLGLVVTLAGAQQGWGIAVGLCGQVGLAGMALLGLVQGNVSRSGDLVIDEEELP